MDPEEEFVPYTAGGLQHPGVFVSGLDKNDGAVISVRYEPGGCTLPHTHSGDEVATVVEGVSEVVTNGVVRQVSAGQSFEIKAGTVHCVRNAVARVLLLSAIFSPPFNTQTTTKA